MNNIILIGPPGAGKTSCGKELAALLNVSIYDTDELIEKNEGKSVRDIFSQDGEEYFRLLESQLLDSLIEQPVLRLGSEGCFVLSTGGGTPIRPGNLAKLNKIGQVVLLEADLETLVSRVIEAGPSRPLLSDSSQSDHQSAARKRLQELLAVRNAIYQQAGYKIDTSELSPAETAERVIDVLELDA